MDLLEGKLFKKKRPSLTEQAQKYFPDEEPKNIIAIVDQHYAGLSSMETRDELMLALIEKYAGDKDMLEGMVNSLKLDYRDALMWLQRFKQG